MKHIISSPHFKQTKQGIIGKEIAGNSPIVDDERRIIKFVVSTATPDRDGDVIVQEGIDLSYYKNSNPVFLWGHDSSELPIGRCTEIDVVDGKLTASFEMLPADVPIAGPRAEAVYRMCKEGFLFATSISFLPIEWTRIDDGDGYEFTKCQLMEISAVSVPANPEATIIQASAQPETIKTLNTNDDAKARRKRHFEYISRKYAR
jgi:HK97 family phage prohead protease